MCAQKLRKNEEMTTYLPDLKIVYLKQKMFDNHSNISNTCLGYYYYSSISDSVHGRLWRMCIIDM